MISTQHLDQDTQKMVNKRTKIIKTNCSEALMAESTESGAIVGSNDDLVTNILRRLPVTYILRFKSVSKHWHSLLSNRRFTLSYDNVPVSPGLFLRDVYIPFDVENPTPPPFRRLNFHPDRSGIKIVQSCNGLLLCCSNRRRDLPRKYYVFNPTTKQFAVIPSLIGGSGATTTIRFMGLAFHGANCVNYKLVCFCTVNRYRNMFQIQIYSSDTGKWRISQESFSSSDLRCSGFNEVRYGVYWNGAVHWISSSINMVSFKLDIEQVQKTLLPERKFGYPGERPYYFGESEGHLHLVEGACNKNAFHVNVYDMLSDYSGWFVKYIVELDELPMAYPFMVYISNQDPLKYEFEVVDVVRGEEEEESAFMVVSTREKVIRYNVLSKSFKNIVGYNLDVSGWFGLCTGHGYGSPRKCIYSHVSYGFV